jgi:hypothetical protein
MRIANFRLIICLGFISCVQNKKDFKPNSDHALESKPNNNNLKNTALCAKEYFIDSDTIMLCTDSIGPLLNINKSKYRIKVFHNNRFGMCGNLNLWPDYERGQYLALGYSCKNTMYYAYFSYNKNSLNLISLHYIDNIDNKMVDISKNRKDTINALKTKYVDVTAMSFLSDTVFSDFPYFEKYTASKSYINYLYRDGNWTYKARSKEEDFILYKFYNPI